MVGYWNTTYMYNIVLIIIILLGYEREMEWLVF